MPQHEAKVRWFDTQIKPHEPILRAWLHNQFPQEGDVDDIVQEAYLRLWQLYGIRNINSPKAYLFATARNLALLQLRRYGRRFVVDYSECIMVVDDSAGVPDEIDHAEDLAQLTNAIQSLPVRCREIIVLRKVHRLSQREVAAQLGLSERTVEGQVAIGIRKLLQFFQQLERTGSS